MRFTSASRKKTSQPGWGETHKKNSFERYTNQDIISRSIRLFLSYQNTKHLIIHVSVSAFLFTQATSAHHFLFPFHLRIQSSIGTVARPLIPISEILIKKKEGEGKVKKGQGRGLSPYILLNTTQHNTTQHNIPSLLPFVVCFVICLFSIFTICRLGKKVGWDGRRCKTRAERTGLPHEITDCSASCFLHFCIFCILSTECLMGIRSALRFAL